ncbi:thioredoxin-like domain-containing protein [Plebeiibacterium marinum]|uniref:Thioredoxin-like domain-containing protein n=1 Tax=Plebeiibacterium marinum TaxID=2992111 RepID=A0AAE3MG88_9BACT|nr:thioredoxin-like domain-containing protein [Plebeiobacterium marinum]MCW3806911.1 thioredoxin-like domain-containing protein [Plebeiobacterium marinum]
MKRIILYVISALAFLACTPNQNPQTKKAIVAGCVSNYDKVSDHNIIEIFYDDILAGQIKLSEKINPNGQFKFVVDLDYPTAFYLKYSGLLTYHISPGDSLHFEINADCWSKTSNSFAEEYSFYKVSGTSKKMNNDVAAYTAFFIDSINNMDEHDEMVKNASPLEYRSYVEALTKERIGIVEEFNKTNNTCPQFRNWVNHKLEYDKWDELMRYRWLHPMHNQKDMDEFMGSIPREYFDFFSGWDKDNKECLSSNSYLSFLHEYTMYVDQCVPQDSQKVYRALYNTDFEKSMGFFLRYYPSVETGFIKDVLISKFYYRLLGAKYYDKIKNIYYPELIEDEYLKQRVQSKFKIEKDLFENPQYAAGSKINQLATENNYLNSLKEKFPGKVLYIDFWAPWCSPCMGEMPHAKNIKKHFEGEDVVFIYLANRCEESAWKSTIAEKKIEGEHFHLNDKQFAELGQVFNITGIPHYALINKEGVVVRNKAPRPSNGKELIELIEKQLN